MKKIMEDIHIFYTRVRKSPSREVFSFDPGQITELLHRVLKKKLRHWGESPVKGRVSLNIIRTRTQIQEVQLIIDEAPVDRK